ncbi:MAG: Site-specific recombinase XerD, partial [Mucilaginibacter sp.]|nr:Site-specific recombinase XerD [Mucilaginibacter sp.]
QGLKSKKTTPQRNKAFTPVLYEKIKKELSRTGYENLRDYCEWITLSSMRPAEIRELKIVDIDEINRQIRIKGKTGDRLVPISDQLLNLIHRRNLAGKDVNSYVFGYMGNVDLRRMSVAYFLEQFAVIKRLLNLDWRYGPYSFKPTGIIMMIKAGIPDKDIMDLTGHKTESAFAAYKRDLVLENSSIMKGKTIDF